MTATRYHYSLAYDTEYAHGEPGRVELFIAPEGMCPGPDGMAEGTPGEILEQIEEHLTRNGYAEPDEFAISHDTPGLAGLVGRLRDAGFQVEVLR